MRTKILLIASAAALFASPAAAAEFTGPRAEIRGGWDRTTLKLEYDDGDDVYSDKGSDAGFAIGAEVGYDFPVGTSMIAGGYAGVEFASTKDCGEVYGDDEACLKLGRNLTLGARLGGKVSPNAMLYAKGGYTSGQFKASYENFEDSDFDFSDKENRDGFHFGLGGEFAVGPKGYVRAEYVRTNYNDYDYSDDFADVKVDSHRDQLLLGFGLRF